MVFVQVQGIQLWAAVHTKSWKRQHSVRKLGWRQNIECQIDDLRGIHTVCAKRGRSIVRFLCQGANLEEGW